MKDELKWMGWQAVRAAVTAILGTALGLYIIGVMGL